MQSKRVIFGGRGPMCRIMGIKIYIYIDFLNFSSDESWDGGENV